MEPQEQQPAEERRGGDKPDWTHVQAGEELPEFPDAAPPVTIDDEYDPEANQQ